MMGTPLACPVPSRFMAVFDKEAKRWRGAALPIVQGSSVLILSFAPSVKPGAFCDPVKAFELRAAAIRAMRKRVI